MKLIVKYPQFFERLTVYFSTFIRFLLNILLLITVIALVVGVCKSGIDLFNSLGSPLETILQRMLLDIIFIVALVEITITILGYLKDGNVQIQYIVDTIFIIMLNEVVRIWFKDPSIEHVGGICLTLLTLAIVRVSVMRYGAIDKS